MPCWPSLQTYAYLKCWGSLHTSSVHADSQVHPMRYWNLQTNSVSCQCILSAMAQHLPSSWAHKTHWCLLKPTQSQYKVKPACSNSPNSKICSCNSNDCGIRWSRCKFNGITIMMIVPALISLMGGKSISGQQHLCADRRDSCRMLFIPVPKLSRKRQNC